MVSKTFSLLTVLGMIVISTIIVNAQGATTYPGNVPGNGAIPDGNGGCFPSPTTSPMPGAALDITFNVAGFNGTVGDVYVDMNISHTSVGQLTATLIAPGGQSHILYSRTGAQFDLDCGDDSNLGGVYAFNDTAGNTNWWNAAASGFSSYTLPAGIYQTTAPGGPQPNRGMVTSMNSVFGGTSANGTWTLRFTDGYAVDTGSVSAANLRLTPETPGQLNFSTSEFIGSEATGTATVTVERRGTLGEVMVDYATSDGTATGGASCTAGVDYISTNGSLTFPASQFGVVNRTFPVTICPDTDLDLNETINLTLSNPTGGATLGSPATAVVRIVDSSLGRRKPYDFFGNGLTDFAILTFPSSGGQVRWRVLKNENPPRGGGTIFDIPFGNSETDAIPNIGDYDGNGVTDLTVYRFSTGSPANSFITLPLNENAPPNNATFTQFGIFDPDNPSDNVTAGGDYDGDGKMDITVVRDPVLGTDGQNLVWYVLRSSDNSVMIFYYGLDTDLIMPGADYTGDGVDDPTVARVTNQSVGTLGFNVDWYVGTTSGQVTSKTRWGNFAVDFLVPGGDYDGDGKADFMAWRGFGSGTNGVWYLKRSSDGGFSPIKWGIGGNNMTRDTALRGGDYDGDGKDDVSIYRPSTNTFWVLRSSDGNAIIQNWGVPGNTNIPVAGFGVQ